jgi:hypothetical protein
MQILLELGLHDSLAAFERNCDTDESLKSLSTTPTQKLKDVYGIPEHLAASFIEKCRVAVNVKEPPLQSPTSTVIATLTASTAFQSERSLKQDQNEMCLIERKKYACQREILKLEAALQLDLDELSKAEPSSEFANFITSCISTTQTDIDKLQAELREVTATLASLPLSITSQSEKVSSSPFSSQDENNWRAAGTIIFDACDQARHFVEESFKNLHKEILGFIDESDSTVSSSPGDSSEMHFSKHYEDYKNDKLQTFAFSVIDCHVSMARQIHLNPNPVRACDVSDEQSYQVFLQHAQQVRIAWQNSDRNNWLDPILGPFEMAKLFCKSFGSTSKHPRGFGDLEPSSLLRMLMRCTFFTMNDRQLFRARTLKGCLWSYKLWKASYSSSQLDLDNFSRIRSILSQFIQEVNVAKSIPANLVNLQEYFMQIIDPFAGSVHSFDSSVDTSTQGDVCNDREADLAAENPHPIVWKYSRARSKVEQEKVARAEVSLRLPVRLTNVEFAAIKLRECFIAAQVTFSVRLFFVCQH